ncbi:hypothetical protein, partial [Marinilabilia sp.]
MKFKGLIWVIIHFLVITGLSAQTGPAGIGNGTGTDGQPLNSLWLDAGALDLNNNDPVQYWYDKSGNDHDAVINTESLRPQFKSTGIGGKPALYFDGSNYMDLGQPGELDYRPGTDEFSMIAVFNSTGDGTIISKGYNDSNQRQFQFYTWSSGYLYTRIGGTQSSNSTSVLNNNYITNFTINTSNVNAWLNGAIEISGGSIGTATNSVDVIVGGRRSGSGNTGSGFRYNGNIAEVIMFSNALNDAERIIINNYLSEKYGITTANDYYSNSDGYNSELVGIATTNGTVKHDITSGSGGAVFFQEINSSLDASNEFLLAAHNNAPHGITTNNIPGLDRARWERIWYIDKTGNIDAQIKFSTEDAGLGSPTAAEDYMLLYRSNTSSDFEEVSVDDVSIFGDKVVFDVADSELSDGYYTLGLPANKKWYSLKSGDWHDWETWTLDPSGSLPNNPEQLTPDDSEFDEVYILNGKTVTIDAVNDPAPDNKNNSLLFVDGR